MKRVYADAIDAFIPLVWLGYGVMCDIGINYPRWWVFASKNQVKRYLEYVKDLI